MDRNVFDDIDVIFGRHQSGAGRHTPRQRRAAPPQ